MIAHRATGTERGIVLIALLLVLLGSSSLWLARVPESVMPLAATMTTPVDMERLRRAREAVLAHASLYAWTYGPTGAGPGHLPCPDTDARPGSSGSWQRAGPDPPCAARPVATGMLPLHVTVGALRSSLDPLGTFAPALGYRVAAQVVNNPQGRLVDGALSLSEVLRIGAMPGSSVVGSSSLSLGSTLLLDPVERGVAAWAVEQLERLPSTAADSLCRSATACRLSGALATGEALLETVTRTGHWFVRNGWDDDMELLVEDACRDTGVRCHWSIDDRDRRAMRRATSSSFAVIPPIRLRLGLSETFGR